MARRKRSRKSSGSHRRRRRSTRTVTVFKANPRRRRSGGVSRRRSRRYRRNPSLSLGGVLPTSGLLKEAVYITGGFVGTKMLSSFVLPMVGIQQPALRIALKGVLAGVVGLGGKMVLGKQAGTFLMIGGLVEAVNDALQTYVAPMVPQLAMSSYPELYDNVGAYPQLSGMVEEGISEQV